MGDRGESDRRARWPGRGILVSRRPRPEIEAGWVVGREHWGSGWQPRPAARRSFEDISRTLGVAHVISLIDPANVASVRVAEKLGGSVDKTGEFRGHEILFYGYAAPPALTRDRVVRLLSIDMKAISG